MWPIDFHYYKDDEESRMIGEQGEGGGEERERREGSAIHWRKRAYKKILSINAREGKKD